MTEKDLNQLRQQDNNLREAIARRARKCPQMPPDLNERLMERVEKKPHRSFPVFLKWMSAAACIVAALLIGNTLLDKKQTVVPQVAKTDAPAAIKTETALVAQAEPRQETKIETPTMAKADVAMTKPTPPITKVTKPTREVAEKKDTATEDVPVDQIDLQPTIPVAEESPQLIYASIDEETEEDSTYQSPGKVDEFIAQLAANYGVSQELPDSIAKATFLSNDFADMNREKNNRMAGLGWELTEEGDNTVLHCYLKMPADVVKNLWLASDETGIVDLKTGKNYRALRSVPDCWGKYFAVKAKEGTVLDFQIFFPKLPSSTTRIAIYGVPNWFLRGKALTIKRIKSGKAKYDKAPDFKQPKMVSKEKDYDKNNGHSWEVYTEPHIIKPTPEGTMAIWRTAEATYLAVAHEQNWMREYFGIHPNTILGDQSGHMYKLKEVKGLPSNGHLFWMEGYSGDHIAFLYVFEPIPLDVNTISFLEPDSEPFNAWGANWKGDSKYGLDINELRENQKLFKYNKRKVVK